MKKRRRKKERKKEEAPNVKVLMSFFSFACACETISIRTHSIDSRFVIGPSNMLFTGVYVGICQPGNFTGWGSEGVKKLIRKIFMFTHFILFYFGPALGQNWWWPSYSIALFLPCYKTIAFGQNSLVVVLRWFAFRSKPNDISTYFTRLYVVGSSFALFEVTDSGGRNSDLLLKYIYRLSAPSACLAA